MMRDALSFNRKSKIKNLKFRGTISIIQLKPDLLAARAPVLGLAEEFASGRGPDG